MDVMKVEVQKNLPQGILLSRLIAYFFIGESEDHLGSFLHLMEKAKTAPK